VAKPYALDLQQRFWRSVQVVPFTAPWTAFKYINKYRLWAWRWGEMFRLRNGLAAERFDFGLSARWDHTRAGQPVRVWPLERYRELVARLRQDARLAPSSVAALPGTR
jgi:ADP-heptose:LPS heptosyltransferase